MESSPLFGVEPLISDYTVAAHVESPEGVRVALENGVDSIEHGAAPDEEILRLFRERGAFLWVEKADMENIVIADTVGGCQNLFLSWSKNLLMCT